MATKGSALILSVLKNETHAYDGLMDEQDLWDLANFAIPGQVNMDSIPELEHKLCLGALDWLTNVHGFGGNGSAK